MCPLVIGSKVPGYSPVLVFNPLPPNVRESVGSAPLSIVAAPSSPSAASASRPRPPAARPRPRARPRPFGRWSRPGCCVRRCGSGRPGADQLALVGDQQHFVAILDRERRHQPAAARTCRGRSGPGRRGRCGDSRRPRCACRSLRIETVRMNSSAAPSSAIRSTVSVDLVPAPPRPRRRRARSASSRLAALRRAHGGGVFHIGARARPAWRPRRAGSPWR